MYTENPLNPDFCSRFKQNLNFLYPKRQIRADNDNHQTEQKNTMDLQYLEFDCSEDTEGIVCWDALAQPAASHTVALLREVTQLLAWASRFSPQGPGPLDEGADWDFDLQVAWQSANSPDVQHRLPAQAHWHAAAHTLDIQPATAPTLGPDARLELSLSLSGTPAFAQAFREHWNAP